jgi:ELWxxDGT repeat protein
MPLFAVNDGTQGLEPWKSNGTEAVTLMVMDVLEGSGS